MLRIVSRTQTKFAVRASGQNPNSGFCNVDEAGIVIDLTNLNSMTLDNDGILHAGAGSTWGDVYAWLEARDRSVMGSRSAELSLSGFLLGGTLHQLQCYEVAAKSPKEVLGHSQISMV